MCGDFSSNLRDGNEHSPCTVPNSRIISSRYVSLACRLWWCSKVWTTRNFRKGATVSPTHFRVDGGAFQSRLASTIQCGAPFFLRLFGGHDPKFRLILHLFHYRYGTILPSFDPGSGYHRRADHPLSISHPPRRSYDADNPSIATSLVPDSTIGGVCSIRRKTIKDWYSIPRELEVWTTSILVRCIRDKCRSSRLVYEGHRRNVNVCIGVGSCPLLHNCFLSYH